MTALTPMMKQYLSIKQNHQEAILFFRLGDFYEMFFDDAVTASQELEITLTARDGGNGQKVPMCGVPYHAADGYLAKLISKGHSVAICEQVEDPGMVKGIVKREVVRIVTPGTILESSILNEFKQNYLLAIYQEQTGYGIAYTDISTGEFMVTEIIGAAGVQRLIDEIGIISPAECILPDTLYHDTLFRSKLNMVTRAKITQINDDDFKMYDSIDKIKHHFNVASLEALGLSEMPLAICSTGAVLSFLEKTQKRYLSHINKLRVYSTASGMLLDNNTRRNLELTSTIRGGERKGSLLWVCDRTVTSMGARLLKKWIEKPLIELNEISNRLDGVEELTKNVLIREDLRILLKKIYDLERLVGKISFGSASPRDLIALKNSFTVFPEILELLKSLKKPIFKDFVTNFDLMEEICSIIETAINNDPPISVKDGGIIKEGYNNEVDELRLITSGGKKWIADLEAKEKNSTGIKSLKVGYNKVFGYYIEITKSNLSAVPENYIRKQTLANAERYITEDLKVCENKILGANDKLSSIEYDLFVYVRSKVAQSSSRIQKVAAIIAQLDVLLSFAQIALENGYSKPEVANNDVIHIIDGRHPVVEKISDGSGYIPNDTYLDNQSQQICLLTGPNMAGKSTYMRQVALVVLMAQIGSFVPAGSAQIGIVDRIFTRVGAADDLAGGQSTFMVEMSETSNILRNATKSSLIILDEIGRGTSTYDGLSIAWAVVEYLIQPEIGAKTLFATHYHELTRLADENANIKNYTVAVKEKEGGIVFLRKIVPGATDKSYGIQVAKLAGLPEDLLKRAKEILTGLENTSNIKKNDEYVFPIIDKDIQDNDIRNDSYNNDIIKELESLNLTNMTPLNALITLNQWQQKINNG